MKKIISTALSIAFVIVFTACNSDPRETGHPGLHQELMPTGKATDMNPNDTLSLGQHDSIAHNPK